MGVFGEPLVQDGYVQVFSGRVPQRVRLLRLAPWLIHLEWWHLVVLTVAAVAVAIGANHHAYRPHAETLASVDGKPITSTDLAAEAQAEGVVLNSIDAAGRKRLLARVIDRRLLVEAAGKAGIVDDAGFQAMRARSDEMFLAGVVVQRFVGTPPVIEDAEARKFMAAQPAMFAARQTYVIDAIAVDLSQVPAAMLDKIDTMSDATAMLRTLQIPTKHVTQRLDSATMVPKIAASLAALPPGKVLVINRGQASIIGVVLDRVANPVSPDEQLQAARAAMARQQVDARIEHALTALRTKAKISYTAGKPN